MSFHPVKLTWGIRAFHYDKVRTKEDKGGLPLQKGAFYVLLEMEKSPSGTIIPCTVKVSKSESLESPVVTLDLALYATLPKVNSISALRVHRRDNMVIVTHRDLANNGSVQAYSRLMAVLGSESDSRDLAAYLSSVCEDAPAVPPRKNALNPYMGSERANTQAPLIGDNTLAFLSSQTYNLDMSSQFIRPSLDDGLLDALDRGKNARSIAADPPLRRSKVVPLQPEPSASSRPVNDVSKTISPQAGTAQASVSDALTSIYGLPLEELQSLVARVVREEGFTEFVGLSKASASID